jgi:agmatinase
MIHLGLRGCGSARTAEAKAAEVYGSIVVGAHAIHTQGVDAALEKVPSAERYYISLDTDGLDPAIAPGVCFPAPGGLSYYQATDLIRGIAKKGKIVGFDLVELTPHLDPTHLTGQVAAMLILNVISSLAYEGHVGTV